MRYMMLLKLDLEASPKGPSDELRQEMGKLLEEMTRQGVLLDTGGLHPVEESTVIRLSGGKQTVLDGPYAEAKEVIGGYCILQAKSRDEAVAWTQRLLTIHGDDWTITTEVREIAEPDL